MRFGILYSGQENVGWEHWRELAPLAEEAGFEAFFRSDHYLSVAGQLDRGGLDAWATLAALGPLTKTIRLGTLVSPATFRHPSELAKVVVTADHTSGGRVELGIGAGWYEAEHVKYGFPFPPLKERMALLGEQLEIVRRSWTDDQFSYSGEHYALEDLAALPKPVQRPHPPIVMGGVAGPKGAALAARYAQEYNHPLTHLPELLEKRRGIVEACEKAGRDPSEVMFSVMGICVLGADRSEVLERARRTLMERYGGDDPAETLEAQRALVISGTIEEALPRFQELADAGVERFYVWHLSHEDVEMVHLVRDELLPRFA